MKKQIKNKLAKDTKQFLVNQSWKVYTMDDSKYAEHFTMTPIEELPFKPKYLIEKDEQKLWVYYFWKGAYPYWNSQGAEVTGFDWWKYMMMIGLSAVTRIPCAVMFDSESNPEIIFRQLDQLPKPKHSRANKHNCARSHEPYRPLQYDCFKCWRDKPQVFSECKRQRKKMFSGVAIWKKECFTHDTIYQPQIL